MFHLPHIYGVQNKLGEVNAACQEECVRKSSIPCDETVFQLCCLIMQEHFWNVPTSLVQGMGLYKGLRNEIRENV